MPLTPLEERTRGGRRSFPVAGELDRQAVLLHRRDAARVRAAPTPPSLRWPRASAQALGARGIERLYSHQTRAIQAALAGRHVVVATPTASGKSLCFHLPVLQALAEDPNARALYLFPTKALARDQEAAFRELDGRRRASTPAQWSTTGTPPATRGGRRASGRA